MQEQHAGATCSYPCRIVDKVWECALIRLYKLSEVLIAYGCQQLRHAKRYAPLRNHAFLCMLQEAGCKRLLQ